MRTLPLLASFPGWAQVWNRLEARRSVLVHVPRFSGERVFARTFRELWSSRGGRRSVEIHVPSVLHHGELRPASLAAMFEAQACLPLEVSEDGDPYGIFDRLHQTLAREPGSTLVVVRGGRRGDEEGRYRLIAGFCELISRFGATPAGDLTLLVLDDYSMYFYEDWRNEVSRFDFLAPICLRAVKERELERFFESTGLLAGSRAQAAASRLHALTGGHHGLILDFLDNLGIAADAVPPDPGSVAELECLVDEARLVEARAYLEDSRILDDLQRLLASRPQHFCSEALHFVRPRLFPPKTADRQYLAEIGVLVRSGTRLELCPGQIRTLVEEIAGTVEAPVSGFETCPSGSIRIAEPLDGTREPDFDDDDFVVVHLSDLHVGPQYRFQLRSGDFTGRKKAHELLQQDLEQLGIADRVDALVVSGDFVELGTDFAQFQRAREVVDAMRENLGLDWSSVVVVAGNHDIDWTPSGFAEVRPETKVSRDHYDAFYRMLGKEPEPASLTVLTSRGGRRRLRLLGLDSNLVEGPDAGGIGYVGSAALERADRLLRELELDETDVEQVATWIVVHHHLFPARVARRP